MYRVMWCIYTYIITYIYIFHILGYSTRTRFDSHAIFEDLRQLHLGQGGRVSLNLLC